MERKISNELLKWKNDLNRKPLILYGPRQVGKTYSTIKFGEDEYKTLVYINTKTNDEFKKLVLEEKNVDKLMIKLSALTSETILKSDTLIILDNLNDIDIVNSIKRLAVNLKEYHIIMITPYKENLIKYKGEELQFRYMFGVDFEEYLKAQNQDQLVSFIKDSFINNKKMPFHSLAMEYFDEYLAVGENPGTVRKFLDNDKNYNMLYAEHNNTLAILKNELFNNDSLIDMQRGNEVLSVLPKQLDKTNKKFLYTLIKDGARSKEYEGVIDYLSNNNLVNRAYKVSEVGTPLSKKRDKDSFKLYANNTGLLYHGLNLNIKRLITNTDLRYLLIENNIANNIVASGYNLYYYQSEGKAEVSFVVQTRRGQTIPVDITKKDEAKSKSLALFIKRFESKEAIRFVEDNFSRQKNVKNIPIYASFCFKEYL